MKTLRRLVVIPVAMLFAGIFIGLHAYLLSRMVELPGWSPGVTRVATVIVWSLAVLLFVGPIAERFLTPDRARWIVWPSAVWMGSGWILLVTLAATDVVVGLLGFVGSPDLAPAAAKGRALLVLAIALPAAGMALAAGRRRPAVPARARRKRRGAGAPRR